VIVPALIKPLGKFHFCYLQATICNYLLRLQAALCCLDLMAAASTSILRNIPQVFELHTAMRFKDGILISILSKMRQRGGSKLTNAEWTALCNTKIENIAKNFTSAALLEKQTNCITHVICGTL
jgi:hypothetical protein